MKFRKVFVFGMLLPLTACGGKGGSSIKGEKVEESDFSGKAAERVEAEQPNYTSAKMTAKHYQKVAGKSNSMDGYATYTRQNGAWVSQEVNGVMTQMSTYVSIINFTMDLYERFFSMLASYGTLTDEFYLDDNSATIHLYGDFTISGNSGTIDCVIVWNQYGMLKSYKETDNYNDYRGTGSAQVKETFTATYSA